MNPAEGAVGSCAIFAAASRSSGGCSELAGRGNPGTAFALGGSPAAVTRGCELNVSPGTGARYVGGRIDSFVSPRSIGGGCFDRSVRGGSGGGSEVERAAIHF